jgi:hypothetical protein
MKKLALGLVFLIGSMASAFAACTNPVVMHDFPGTSFNMSVVTAPTGANDCQSNVAIPTWAGGTLGAMANYGTSPGAVLVPGVNAFLTNAATLALAATQGATTVAPATTPTTTAAETEISLLKAITYAAVSPLPAGTATIGTAGSLPYPVGAVPYTATATGTTAATTATLAGAASVTTYICGFSIRANATAAATGNATVTGVITATLNFTQWTAPNASGLGVTEMIFSPCVPASATNTSIAVVSAAPGTGGVVSVTAWGYKL